MDDILDRAQRLVDDPTTSQHIPTASVLALVDIARSLRDIAGWCNNNYELGNR